jgi:hypothetical protein
VTKKVKRRTVKKRSRKEVRARLKKLYREYAKEERRHLAWYQVYGYKLWELRKSCAHTVTGFKRNSNYYCQDCESSF